MRIWEDGKVPLSRFELTLIFISLPQFHTLLCSSVHLCTASLHGSVTCMCHCWTGYMSTTPLNTHVASSCVRTTAPMKLSSSRCEPSTLTFVKWVGWKVGKKMTWQKGVRKKKNDWGKGLPELGCTEREIASLMTGCVGSDEFCLLLMRKLCTYRELHFEGLVDMTESIRGLFFFLLTSAKVLLVKGYFSTFLHTACFQVFYHFHIDVVAPTVLIHSLWRVTV